MIYVIVCSTRFLLETITFLQILFEPFLAPLYFEQLHKNIIFSLLGKYHTLVKKVELILALSLIFA